MLQNSHMSLHTGGVDGVEPGYDIRTIQDLLGHKDASTTMIYTHVLNKGGKKRPYPTPVDAAFDPLTSLRIPQNRL